MRSPDQEPQPGRSGLEKGSRRDWGSRLSLHRQLLRQAPSSPSEGATQPREGRVGKFLRCPGTAAYLHSVIGNYLGLTENTGLDALCNYTEGNTALFISRHHLYAATGSYFHHQRLNPRLPRRYDT